MNSKPAFQEFVEANQALLACYNAVSVDDYKKLSESARENLCSQPKEKLRDIMRGN